MRVIGISGKAESGKTYTANILRSILTKKGNKVQIIPLATLLKEQAKGLGWNEKKDERGRTFLQGLGKLLKNYHGKNYYAKTLIERIKNTDTDIILIDDLRLPEEVEALKNEFKNDFVTIRIERPNHENNLSPTQKEDISETGLDDYVFDFFLENTEKNFKQDIYASHKVIFER